jgi:hypothetical protein
VMMIATTATAATDAITTPSQRRRRAAKGAGAIAFFGDDHRGTVFAFFPERSRAHSRNFVPPLRDATPHSYHGKFYI